MEIQCRICTYIGFRDTRGELFEGEPIHPRLVKQPIYSPPSSCTFVRPFCMLSKCDGQGRGQRRMAAHEEARAYRRFVLCRRAPLALTLSGVAVSASIRRRASLAGAGRWTATGLRLGDRYRRRFRARVGNHLIGRFCRPATASPEGRLRQSPSFRACGRPLFH
jgi:hypothetical protein